MGNRTSVGTRVVLLGAFFGAVWVVLRSGCGWGYGIGGLGGRGFETDFHRYDKIIHWNWGRYSFLIPVSSV